MNIMYMYVYSVYAWHMLYFIYICIYNKLYIYNTYAHTYSVYNLVSFIPQQTTEENKMWELSLPVRLRIRNSQQ